MSHCFSLLPTTYDGKPGKTVTGHGSVVHCFCMKAMDILYRHAVKPILFKFDPETVHDAFIVGGDLLGRSPLTRGLFSFLWGYHGPDISKTVDGIRFHTPILLSAGFDTDGRLTRILPSLGFGGEEVGSTTALPCEGNPRPRLTRLIRNNSIIVFKGLRNHGVDALIKHLSRTKRQKNYVIGISIARTNTRASTINVESGIADYATSFKKIAESGVGDYITLNISCPNSFDGETFTEPELLDRLLTALKPIACPKPVYLKMPINLPNEKFIALCYVASKYPVSGLIIGNLNKDYNSLEHREDAPMEYRGGLSGKPCFARSNELIRITRAHFGKRFTIFGVGGIFSADDAMAKLDAGADLLMLVTGMIFGTPGLMTEIDHAYAKRIGKK